MKQERPLGRCDLVTRRDHAKRLPHASKTILDCGIDACSCVPVPERACTAADGRWEHAAANGVRLTLGFGALHVALLEVALHILARQGVVDLCLGDQSFAFAAAASCAAADRATAASRRSTAASGSTAATCSAVAL